jgi:regulator of sirC expression with transglutaminase-like and TPR domain
MKKPISLLLDQFQQREKEREEKGKEFGMLARRVKDNIRALISQNRMEEAGRYTEQLAALMPNDQDVFKFRALIHSELHRDGLAAHLPQ